MVEKREQVFVSSTFKDLVDERAAVIQTLLEADCMPSGMEMFPASDSEKFDLIKRVIDLCDYYVVIIGGRYGSVDAERQLSYTEMEYDYAVQVKKPVMAFLHGDPGKLPGEKLELDAEVRKMLDAFRAKTEARMVKYWREPGDLNGAVALAIMQIRKTNPAEGWIRAGEAMTPETKAELAELRAQVRELTADLKDEKGQHALVIDQSDLVQGNEIAHLTCEVTFDWLSTLEAGRASYNNRSQGFWIVEPSWNQLVRHLGPDLMDEAAEPYLIERLSALCLDMASDELLSQRGAAADDDDDGDDDGHAEPAVPAAAEAAADDADDADDDEVARIYEAKVTMESFNDVKVQFVALGLIEQGTKRRLSSDRQSYWRLTHRGREQLMRLRAIRKSALTPTDVRDGDD